VWERQDCCPRSRAVLGAGEGRRSLPRSLPAAASPASPLIRGRAPLTVTQRAGLRPLYFSYIFYKLILVMSCHMAETE